MYNRTTSSALRGLSRSRCLSLRQFSTTPRYGIRIVFKETGKPELDKLFHEIQKTIIFPAHLPEKQRKIIFNTEKTSFLKQNPITIELEGVEHSFSTIDRAKDIRKTHIMLFEAIDLMETNEDWANLPTLLAGYKKAGIKLDSSLLGKISRKASFTDQVSPILECAKQSAHTGFYIANKEQINHTLSTINNKIDAAAGDVQLIQRLAKMAEQVFDIVQRPAHRDLFQEKSPRNQLHNSLTAQGQLLFAHAALVSAKTAAGEPIDAELVSLRYNILQLSALWAPHADSDVIAVPELAELNPTANKSENNLRGIKAKSPLSRRNYVKALARTIKAVDVAQQIVKDAAGSLDPVTAELGQLRAVADKLEAHLEQFAEGDQKNNLAVSYKSVMGRLPAWSGLPSDLAEVEDVKKPAQKEKSRGAQETEKQSEETPSEEEEQSESAEKST